MSSQILCSSSRPHIKFKHPNIVKYKGFEKTREYLYIILEYASTIVAVNSRTSYTPCSFGNEMPSSKSSSQLSVSSSGGTLNCNGSGLRIFCKGAGMVGGFSEGAAGGFQNEEADVEGCIEPSDDGCTAGPKSRAYRGDGGCSLSAFESWRRRSGCLEGREGAVVASDNTMSQCRCLNSHLRASFHSCTFKTASS